MTGICGGFAPLYSSIDLRVETYSIYGSQGVWIQDY
jgi:hypothetical protein